MNQFLTWKGSTIRNFDLRVQVRISSGGQWDSISWPFAARDRFDAVSGYQCDVVAKRPEYNGML